MKLIRFLLIAVLSAIAITGCSDDKDKYDIRQFPNEGILYTFKISETEITPNTSEYNPECPYGFAFSINFDFYYLDEIVSYNKGQFRATPEYEKDLKYLNENIIVYPKGGIMLGNSIQEDGVIHNSFDLFGSIKEEYDNLSEAEKKDLTLTIWIYAVENP